MYSRRLDRLPPYLFARIDEMKSKKQQEGVDVIDLGVGDPDLPSPPHVVDALCKAAKDPVNHHYPSYAGLPVFRSAAADWYKKRFGVSLDGESEVISLMGSKDGIAHFNEAFVNPGDYVLCPSPGYPVYQTSTLFSEGSVYAMPLKTENKFIPVLSDIPSEVAKKAKVIFVNYPNNPTSAIVTSGFYKELVDFASDYNIVVVSDNPYSEISFDGYKAPSFLETSGAMEVGVEMHSLSKTYNMTGWRIGMACGNSDILEGLGRVKSNVDSGVFNAVQIAGAAALSGPQDCVREACSIYKERRDALVNGLSELGFKTEPPKATFYVWLPVKNSIGFAASLLEKAGIVATPGVGFGSAGEGYVRFAITRTKERILEAVERMKGISI